MTGDNKRQNVHLELAAAETAMREARLLYEHGMYAGAVSRAYYHAYHCARALLYSEGLEARTHAGLAHLVSLHFVKSARMDARTGRYLGELESERTAAEYDPAAVYDSDVAGEKLARAAPFGEAAMRLLLEAGYSREVGE
jgi:uncharacterized protein (UPF0332 family)